MVTEFCYEHFAGDNLESYHAVFDPRTHVFSFIPTSQKNLYFTKCIFFLSLNNCNPPPYSFRKLPSLPPSTRRSTMWPDRSTTLNNTAQSILASAGRKSSSIVTTLRAIYNIETSSKYGSSSPALALLSHYTNTCRISIVSHLLGNSLFLQQFTVTQLIKNSNVVTKHSCLCSQKTTNGRFRKLNWIWYREVQIMKFLSI